MLKFTELLPSAFRTEFSAMVEEGKLVAWASLQAALDVADSATQMASVVAMRHSSWLQASGLPYEVRQTIQDLPFEDSTLLLEKTNTWLHSMKDSRATLICILWQHKGNISDLSLCLIFISPRTGRITLGGATRTLGGGLLLHLLWPGKAIFWPQTSILRVCPRVKHQFRIRILPLLFFLTAYPISTLCGPRLRQTTGCSSR